MAAPLGARRHIVDLAAPATVLDPDGGFHETWAPLTPARWACRMRPAGPADQERTRAGTVTGTATHVMEGWFHPGITLTTRITLGPRIFAVVYIGNVDERSVVMELLTAERAAITTGPYLQ